MPNRKMLRVLGKDWNQAVIGVLVDDNQLKAAVGLRVEVKKKILEFPRSPNGCQ